MLDIPLRTATVAHDLQSVAERPVAIHPTAIVEPGAQLGRGVDIGPFCHVGRDVQLHDNVRLVSHVVVDGDTVVGEAAVLYPFCTVGLAPQDLKYKGEPTRCEVGARTQVREHCTIHRGTVTGTGLTKVGAGCLLMAVVHVAHDCEIGDGVVIANNVVMGGHVTIGANSVIGGSAAIHQFVRIGRGAMIGGVSGVEADVIPFGSVIGNRARLAGLNVIGLRRRGVDRPQLMQLRAAVRQLFWGGGVFTDRLEAVRAAYGSDPLTAEVLEFASAPTKRGLIRASAQTDDTDAA
jgi:UDP-N-acetylglucosamine acyltransferase